MVTKIHHIAIVVENIKDSLDWYCARFGVEVAYADDSWALLQFQNLAVALVLPGQHPRHFAIECREAEAYGELKLHRDGTQSVYTRDPSGNAIEIIKSQAR